MTPFMKHRVLGLFWLAFCVVVSLVSLGIIIAAIVPRWLL